MSKTAVISGIGESRLGKLPDQSMLEFTFEAAKKACDDAGITFQDLDGLILHPAFHVSPRYHIYLTEMMGLYVKTYCDTTQMGGAGFGAALARAKDAVESGQSRHILILGGEKMATGMASGAAMMASAGAHNLDFEYPFGATVPSYYAMLAQRYLYEYNKGPEVFAQVAVTIRKHAHRNPDAYMRDLITVDDVLNSRMVSDPHHLFDCALVSDGAGAYVVSEKGTSKDPKREIAFLGMGQSQSFYHMAQLARGYGEHDLLRSVIDVGAKRAFGQAGLTPQELDVIEIYDSFTSTVVIQLEDLGFCGRGEAGDWLASGIADPDGAQPMTTHGGLLSCAHPGASGGMHHIIEAVKQLRHEAGPHQVAKAETALATSVSAVASNFAVTILGLAA